MVLHLRSANGFQKFEITDIITFWNCQQFWHYFTLATQLWFSWCIGVRQIFWIHQLLSYQSAPNAPNAKRDEKCRHWAPEVTKQIVWNFDEQAKFITNKLQVKALCMDLSDCLWLSWAWHCLQNRLQCHDDVIMTWHHHPSHDSAMWLSGPWPSGVVTTWVLDKQIRHADMTVTGTHQRPFKVVVLWKCHCWQLST